MKTAQLLTAYCVMQCDNATELAKKSGYLSRSIRGWLLGQHEPRYDAVEDVCLSVGLSIGRAVEQAYRAEKGIKQYIAQQQELNAKLSAARRRL